jgi:hypothetical protein
MYSDDTATCTSRDTLIEDAVASCHEDIRKTIHTLQHLRNVAAAERAAVRVRAAGPGRPKRYWSVSFIEAIAYLWQLLTGEVASRSDDSLFGEFVYSAWNSYDDAMPDVSFAHALRNRALTKSRRK